MSGVSSFSGVSGPSGPFGPSSISRPSGLNCRICPLKNGDAPAVAALESACFSDPWGETEFSSVEESRLDQGFAAWVGETLAGYAILRTVAGEGELLRIAVRPDVRGRGIARKLMEQVERAAREAGADSLFLEVRAGNEPALALYRASGFEENGRRKDYYRFPTEDAVLMERSLSPLEDGDGVSI